MATLAPIVMSTTACITRSRPTSAGTSDERTGIANAATVPKAAAITTATGSVITPVHTSTAPRPTTARPAPCVASSILRRSRRSVSAPAVSTSRQTGAPRANTINPDAHDGEPRVSSTSQMKVKRSAEVIRANETAVVQRYQNPVPASEPGRAGTRSTTSAPMR